MQLANCLGGQQVYLHGLGLGPDDASLPEDANDIVEDDTVRAAAVLFHLLEGGQRLSPLPRLGERRDQAAVGDRVWLAALALHLLKELRRPLILCSCMHPTACPEFFQPSLVSGE